LIHSATACSASLQQFATLVSREPAFRLTPLAQ
jgi:hypothetical protein